MYEDPADIDAHLLARKIRELGTGRDDLLDDTVLDVCEATVLDECEGLMLDSSAINNGGLISQTGFLLEAGWPAFDIFLAAVEAHSPEQARALRSRANLEHSVEAPPPSLPSPPKVRL